MGETPPYERIKEEILSLIEESEEGTILQSDVKTHLVKQRWIKDHYSSNSLGARISDAVRELKGDKITVESGVPKKGPGRDTNRLARKEE